jgi:hypothetical protein
MSPLGAARGSEGAETFADDEVQVQHQRVGNIEQPDDRIKVKAHGKGAPFLMDGDFLKVTNRSGSETYVFEWNRKVFVLGPAESKFVLFEALVDKLGDPRSMEREVQKYNDGNGNQGIVMERSFEMDRLFSRYAVLGSHLDDTKDKEGQIVLGLLSKTPHVEVETLNGERVVFPASRPDMLPFPIANVDERRVRSDTTQALDKLESENADMRSALEEMNKRLDAEIRKREGYED